MINEYIKELSGKLLSDKDFKDISKIVNGLASEKKEEYLKELQNVLGYVPKRPLYYLYMETIPLLPDGGMRSSIKNACDYIDQLVKFTLEDIKFFSRWFRRPLGPNIEKLKESIDDDLYNELVVFNKIYTQAKHEFHHDIDKNFFTYEDTVYMIYITKKIAEKILPLSERARDYNIDGITAYRYDYVE